MSDDNYGEDVARHEWYMTKVSGFRVRKYEDDKTLGLQYKTSWHDSTGATWVDELNTGTDDSGLVRRYIRANKATILRVIIGFMHERTGERWIPIRFQLLHRRKSISQIDQRGRARRGRR